MYKKFLLPFFVFLFLTLGAVVPKNAEAAPCTSGSLNPTVTPSSISATTDVSLGWNPGVLCEYIFVSPDPLSGDPQWIYVTFPPYVMFGVNSTQTYGVRAYAPGDYPYTVYGGDNNLVDSVSPTASGNVTVTYNAPQPATLTVYVVDENDTPLSGATWNVFGGSPSPSPSSGSGTSVSHTLYPANGGSFFSVSGYPSQIRLGDILSVTNSDSGGSSIMVAPGQSKWVRLKYSGNINVPCTIQLNTSSNSIVSGNSATLTWSSTDVDTSPFTTGTNFNPGGATANGVGISVSPTVTTTYTINGYDGQAGCSDSETITVTQPPPPTISLSATPACSAQISQNIVTWSGTNATSYTLRRDNSSGQILYTGSGTSFTDSNRTALQPYTYHLTATGPGGQATQTTSATASNCVVAQPPSIISFTATASCNGTTPQMTLTWSATNNPTSYVVKRNNNSGQQIYSGLATSHTDSNLTPSTLYTYYLEVANGTAPNATQTASATTGTCVGGQAPTVTMTAAPDNILSGQGSNMNWSMGGGNANSCSLSANPANPQWTGTIFGADVTTGGHVRAINNITVNTTFSMTCSNASGSNSSSAAVTVVGGNTPVVTISANPSTVSNGNSSALTWSATNNPTSCTASGGWSGDPGTSGTNVSTGPLFGNTTFTLVCSNGNGPGSPNSANVTVIGGGLSDLIMGTPNTTTASLGANTPISIPMTNIGLYPTSPIQFGYAFQITNASNGGGALIAQPNGQSFGALAPSQTSQPSINHVFPSTGTYSVRGCADATGINGMGSNPPLLGQVVNETNENNNCSPWGDITVTPGSMDVLAGPTYTTTPAGVNNMQSWWYFGSLIKNQGTGATPGSGFPSYGQLASQANGGGTITNYAYNHTNSFAPGAQWAATFGQGHVFTAPGTYSTRVCADATGVNNNLATGGVLSESDETNNCGPWNNLIVTMDATVSNGEINVYSDLPSSWDIIPWPASGQTVNPTSGSGTFSSHTASGGGWIYTLSNIQNIPGYTYTVTPSVNQNIYSGRTTPYWINYTPIASTFDYSLSSSGTVSVTKSSAPVQGQSTITKTLTSGTTQAVDITATGMPAGVSVSYANRNCSPTCNTTITFTVDPSTAAGTYPITVTGTSNATPNKTTNFNLVIANPVNVTVTCTPTPSPAFVGQPVTWTGIVVGGTPPYTYAWTGSDFGTGSTNPFVFTYQSTGSKNARLTVTDAVATVGSCPATNLNVSIDPRYREF